MRRPHLILRTLAILPIVLAGCGGGMSVEEARTATVVDVDGATLDGATLERLILAAPRAAPPAVTSSVLVTAFIDAAVLRSAMMRGDSLTDSATVAAAVLPDAVRGLIVEYFNERGRSMPPVSDQAADSVSRLASVRVFQHLLLRVDSAATRADSAATFARAHAIREALTGGADWFATVARESEDTAGRSTGGYLPAVERGDLPPDVFVNTAWALQPGEVSRAISGVGGVRLLRRATVAESQAHVKRWMVPRLARTADSLFVDSLSTALKLTVANGATSRLRMLVREPLVSDGDAPYATWEGGAMDAAQVRFWVSVLPSTDRGTMRTAPDSALVLFLREAAQREIVGAIVTGGNAMSPRAWNALAPQFRAAVASIYTAYHPLLTSGDATAATRSFLDQVTGGGVRYHPFPGALGGVLRTRSQITVNYDAIDVIVANAGKTANALRSDSLEAAAPVPGTP